MDNLQYYTGNNEELIKRKSFKPYYKWITFNITYRINEVNERMCFKPYYKWIIFNIL